MFHTTTPVTAIATNRPTTKIDPSIPPIIKASAFPTNLFDKFKILVLLLNVILVVLGLWQQVLLLRQIHHEQKSLCLGSGFRS